MSWWRWPAPAKRKQGAQTKPFGRDPECQGLPGVPIISLTLPWNAPLAGSRTLTLILPLTIWASGAPLATAITGVGAYRLLCFSLPLPAALASLPVLHEITGRPR
jgi:hypothetical protein